MGNCQINEKSKRANAPSLSIQSSTWQRDSYGLFDYECKSFSQARFRTSSSGHIFRSKNELILISESQNDIFLSNARAKNKSPLLEIVAKNQEGFEILQTDQELRKGEPGNEDQRDLFENAAWIIAKFHDGNKGLKLSVGDFIRLGRIRFKIREISLSTSKGFNAGSSKPKLSSTSMNESNESSANYSKSGNVCRICLSDTLYPDNPLLSPCLCSGTMKYVHLKCLQRWMCNRVQVKPHSRCLTLLWKNFECELCKSSFPTSFDVEGKNYDIVEISKPENNYVILEILSKKRHKSKGVHVLNFHNKERFRIGRGKENDIRSADISVSRLHASLKVRGNDLTLVDENSKFGTLVLLKNNHILDKKNEVVNLQIGRTVLKASYIPPEKVCSSCCKKRLPEDRKMKAKLSENQANHNVFSEDFGEEDISNDELIIENEEPVINQRPPGMEPEDGIFLSEEVLGELQIENNLAGTGTNRETTQNNGAANT